MTSYTCKIEYSLKNVGFLFQQIIKPSISWLEWPQLTHKVEKKPNEFYLIRFLLKIIIYNSFFFFDLAIKT
jgi:hypothetical protein